MSGLLRGIARTAVVAGTATAVSNRVSRRQAGRWAAQDQHYVQERPYVQEHQYTREPEHAAPPPPEPDMETTLAQLKELASLKELGVLSDEEFAQQKARILSS